MLNLIRVEVFKLRKSFSYKMLIVGQLLLCSLFIGMFLYAASLKGSPAHDGVTVSGDLTMNGYDAFLASLGQVQSNAIFTSIFAALFICSEFSNRTLMLPLSTGRKRIDVFIGKSVAFIIGVVGLAMLMPIVMPIFVTAVNGFGHEVTGGFVLKMSKLLGVYLLLNISIACISALIAFMAKGIGATIAVSIGITVGMSILTQARFGAEKIFTKIIKLTPFWQSNEFFRPGSTTTLMVAAVVSVCTIAVILAATYLAFRKDDLK